MHERFKDEWLTTIKNSCEHVEKQGMNVIDYQSANHFLLVFFKPKPKPSMPKPLLHNEHIIT